MKLAHETLKVCNQQKERVEKRIKRLDEVVVPIAEQALQDMDEIPAHDTDHLRKATFISTLHYLEAVKELQKVAEHYNSNGYQVRKLSAFFICYDSDMNKLQHHHLTTLQARIARFEREPEEQNQQTVQKWEQYACTHPKYQQWMEEFHRRSQQVHRRKDEQDVLKRAC